MEHSRAMRQHPPEHMKILIGATMGVTSLGSLHHVTSSRHRKTAILSQLSEKPKPGRFMGGRISEEWLPQEEGGQRGAAVSRDFAGITEMDCEWIRVMFAQQCTGKSCTLKTAKPGSNGACL